MGGGTLTSPTAWLREPRDGPGASDVAMPLGMRLRTEVDARAVPRAQRKSIVRFINLRKAFKFVGVDESNDFLVIN